LAHNDGGPFHLLGVVRSGKPGLANSKSIGVCCRRVKVPRYSNPLFAACERRMDFLRNPHANPHTLSIVCCRTSACNSADDTNRRDTLRARCVCPCVRAHLTRQRSCERVRPAGGESSQQVCDDLAAAAVSLTIIQR